MLENLLNIKTEKRVRFKQHFLKAVLLELLFDNDIIDFNALNQDENFNTVCESLGYNTISPMTNMNFTISMEDDTPNTSTTSDQIGLEVSNETTENQIQLLRNKIIFINRTYESFESFNAILQALLGILPFEKISLKKIGFRKINSFIIRDVKSLSEITELFNDTLFSRLNTQFFALDSFNNYRDNFILSKNNTKQIVNTSCSKINGIEKAYEIILDNDIILNDTINNDLLFTNLAKINQMHFDVFCWAISDKLKDILNKE